MRPCMKVGCACGLGNKLRPLASRHIRLIPQLQRCCDLGVADTATLRESAGVGFWVHLIDVRHSLDSAMEPLHPREAAIKEVWPAKADEKLFWKISPGRRACVCVCARAEPVRDRNFDDDPEESSTMHTKNTFRRACWSNKLFGL